MMSIHDFHIVQPELEVTFVKGFRDLDDGGLSSTGIYERVVRTLPVFQQTPMLFIVQGAFAYIAVNNSGGVCNDTRFPRSCALPSCKGAKRKAPLMPVLLTL